MRDGADGRPTKRRRGRRVERELAIGAPEAGPIPVSTWTTDDGGPFDAPLTAAAETARVRALFDAQYPPGDLIGDLTRFIEAAYFGCDPWEAAIALAKHRRFLPTRLASPAAKGCVRRLRDEHGPAAAERYLRESLYPEALIRALKEQTKPQRIRLRIGPARQYLKDAGVRPVACRPNELPDRSAFGNALFARWLRKQTISHVERLLAEEVTSPVIISTRPVIRPERMPAFYGSRVPAGPFRGRLSAQERLLLKLLPQHTSYAGLAAALGISRDAVKKRARRLRLKLEHC
jgi:hypothetical protein